MIVLVLLGEKSIIKKTVKCEFCRKEISLYVPEQNIAKSSANFGIGKRYVVRSVLAGRLAQTIPIDV